MISIHVFFTSYVDVQICFCFDDDNNEIMLHFSSPQCVRIDWFFESLFFLLFYFYWNLLQVDNDSFADTQMKIMLMIKSTQHVVCIFSVFTFLLGEIVLIIGTHFVNWVDRWDYFSNGSNNYSSLLTSMNSQTW